MILRSFNTLNLYESSQTENESMKSVNNWFYFLDLILEKIIITDYQTFLSFSSIFYFACLAFYSSLNPKHLVFQYHHF